MRRPACTGYHSNDTLTALQNAEVRTYISEPDRGQRHWKEKPEAQTAVYATTSTPLFMAYVY
jgi:hypothetical protein